MYCHSESSDSSMRRFQPSYCESEDSSISSSIKWYCTGCEGLICESVTSGVQYVTPKYPNERKINYLRERSPPIWNPIVHTPVENMLKAVEVMHRSLNNLEPKRHSKDASTSTKHDHKMSTVSVNTDKRQWFSVEEDKVYSYVPESVIEPKIERKREIEKLPTVHEETVFSFVPEKRPSFGVEKRQSFMNVTSKGTSPKQNTPSPPSSIATQTFLSPEIEREPIDADGRKDSQISTHTFNVQNRTPSPRPLFFNFRADSKTDILKLIEKLENAKMRLIEEEKLFEREISMAKTKRSFFKN